MDKLTDLKEQQQKTTGFFSTKFYYVFRSMFIPVTRFCTWAHISPNTVTVFSMVLGVIMCVFFAYDMVLTALAFGLAMSFADIIDGQLAKFTSKTTPFGGILDSAVDRYNEFFLFAGLGLRYYALDRPLWILACASAFLGSVSISYVKARAESDGYECRVGRLQRPERLAFTGVGVLISGYGIDAGIDFVVLVLAFATHGTVIYRLHHVWKQAK